MFTLKRWKVFLFFIGMLPIPAHADIEAVSAVIKGSVSNVQTELTKLQDMKAAVDDLQSSVMQGFNGVKDKVNEIQDVVQNPVGLAPTNLLQGMHGISDGSETEDVAIEEVKATYNRVYGVDNTITVARQKAAQINKIQGDSAARLFARSLILRQELAEEENPDFKLDTIEDALKASASMMIQSSRRWNKILEMQAYINEYKNSVVIQNFVIDKEDLEHE